MRGQLSSRPPGTAAVGRFINAYLDAALWTTVDDQDEPLDNGRYEWRDIEPDWLAGAVADCRRFVDDNWAFFALLEEVAGPDQHGHDFWLSRGGHGTGFWDRGYGAKGQILAERARDFGEVEFGPWSFIEKD